MNQIQTNKMELDQAKECLKDIVTEKTTLEDLFLSMELSSLYNYSSRVLMYLALEIVKRIIEDYKLTKKQDYKRKVSRLSQNLKRLSMKEEISMVSLQTLIDDSHIDIPLCILHEFNTNSIYSHQAYVINNSETVWKVVTRHFQILNTFSDEFQKSNLYVYNLIVAIWKPGQCDVLLENTTLEQVNSEHKCAFLSQYFLQKLVKYFNCGNSIYLDQFLSVFSIQDLIWNDNVTRICYVIIQLLIMRDDKITMQDAYIMQSLWTLKNHTTDCETLLTLLRYSSLPKLSEFMSRYPLNSIDWKNMLLIVGVYCKNFVFGPNELKNCIMNQISSAIDNSRKDDCFMAALILARQACFNNIKSFKTYSIWYASVFGINTAFKTGKDVACFTRLTFLLGNLVKYEPEYALKVHIDRSMRVPIGCQSLMHNFKDLCRKQKAKIAKNDRIPVYNLEVPIVCLLHHAEQFREDTFIFKDAELCLVMLPWLVGDPKYSKIIDLFTKKGLIKKFDEKLCKPKIVAAVEGDYDDSEEFFQ